MEFENVHNCRLVLFLYELVWATREQVVAKSSTVLPRLIFWNDSYFFMKAMKKKLYVSKKKVSFSPYILFTVA